jgi:hypothetical protein
LFLSGGGLIRGGGFLRVVVVVVVVHGERSRKGTNKLCDRCL